MYLKISKFLEKLSFKLRQKGLYYEFKHYVILGENHFMKVYDYNRGIGKSFTLLQLAHKYKCPIIVSNRRCLEYLSRLNRDHFKKSVKIIVANDNCRGRRYNLVLCEEGIDNRLIHEVIIPSCKQVIGFDKQY
jgi:hypothetical protein